MHGTSGASFNNRLISIYFKSQIRSGIKDLNAYIETIENHLESRKEKILKRMEAESDFTQQEASDADALLGGLTMRLGYGRHIDIFSKSAVVSIYSFLEFTLDDICKKISSANNSKIALKHIHGNGI